jgi:DNA-directed RNA polymerase specialized sigma24 family protein
VIVGIQAQKFPELDDREDLWKLLVVVTNRKAIAQQRRHFAAKRPDQRMNEPFGESEIAVPGREPSPEFAVQFAEEVQRMLAALPSEDFRRVALLRMEGYTNREIAEKLDWYEVKVERRLRIIRKQWATEWEETNGSVAKP